MADALRLRLYTAENPDRGTVGRGLRAFNASHVGPPRWKALTILARSGRRIVAGLKAFSHWEWMYVALLWVDEPFRKAGIGRRLMEAAEGEARRRRCRQVWLDTYDFQAPGFYKKLGYRAFAKLANYPVRGRMRTFFAKRLRGVR